MHIEQTSTYPGTLPAETLLVNEESNTLPTLPVQSLLIKDTWAALRKARLSMCIYTAFAVTTVSIFSILTMFVWIVAGSGAPYMLARGAVPIATVIVFLLALFAPLHPSKRKDLKLVVIELIALSAMPVLVHITGSVVLDYLQKLWSVAPIY